MRSQILRSIFFPFHNSGQDVEECKKVPSNSTKSKPLSNHICPIKIENPFQLDRNPLLFIHIECPYEDIAHVGIHIGYNEFTHASSFNKEVKVDNLDTPYYNKCFLKGVRVKELELTTSLL